MIKKLKDNRAHKGNNSVLGLAFRVNQLTS